MSYIACFLNTRINVFVQMGLILAECIAGSSQLNKPDYLSPSVSEG